MNLDLTKIICINCTNIFSGRNENRIVCSNCGHQFDRETYDKLIAYSLNAIKLGYLYRIEYQDQLKDDEIDSVKHHHRLYGIEPQDVAVFCALAALSGIVGNAAYDLVKHIIKKLVSKPEGPKDEHFLETDKEITQFIQYIKDYFNGLENVDVDVRRMINEEIHADAVGKQMMGNLGKPKNIRIRRLVEMEGEIDWSPWELKNLESADFNNLWGFIETEKNKKSRKKASMKVRSTKSRKTKKKSS